MIKKIILSIFVLSLFSCDFFSDHGAYSDTNVVSFNAYLDTSSGCFYDPENPPEDEVDPTAYLTFPLKIETPDTLTVCYKLIKQPPLATVSGFISFKATDTPANPGAFPSLDSYDISSIPRTDPGFEGKTATAFNFTASTTYCPFNDDEQYKKITLLDMEKFKKFKYIVLVDGCGISAGTVTNPFLAPN